MFGYFTFTTLLMASSVGLFIAILIITSLFEKWKAIKKVFATIIVSLIIGAIISAFFCLEIITDKLVWNNGYCDNCKTEWEFSNLEHGKNGSKFYNYYCNECGNTITTHSNFK